MAGGRMQSATPPRPLYCLTTFALSMAMLIAWRTLTFDRTPFGSVVSIET